MYKQVLAVATRGPVFGHCLSLLERTSTGRRGFLRVLTYHRVDELDAQPSLYPGLISATPSAFDDQMRHLATNYNVISVPELLTILRARARLPSRSVLITFDDAYRDFGTRAWPILKRYGLPATLFVPTMFPDHPERAFWWDRLYQAICGSTSRAALDSPLGLLDLSSDATRRTSFKCLKNFIKTLPHVDAMALVDRLCDDLDLHTSEGHVLGWDDLRVLAREGVTLAAHTQTHPLLSRISTEMMRAEVAGSMCDIQRETGSVLPVFAYPSGDFDEQVVHVLRDAGVLLAFSTIEGGNDLLAVDPLRLRRMNVGQRSTLPIFRARLLQQSWFGSQWPH